MPVKHARRLFEKKWFLGPALALGLLLPPPARADQTDWLDNYPEAQARTRRTGKPLLVVFR